MSIQVDNQAAIEFLRQWNATGLWVLTAIATDRKSITTATFTPTKEDRLLEFLQEYNGHRNIYFHVNPVMQELHKKAERQDIKAMAWLHVDLDPRPGEDLAKEHERALRILKEPPGSIPPPTVIIFSGGGYQGFWKLEEPIPIDGDLGKAEDAKLYNIQLETIFGADNCHNIDRIMRLPGTLNIPDKVKKRKGRLPTLATLIDFSPSRIYAITLFSQAKAIQSSETGFQNVATKTVTISSNIKRIKSIDDLPDTVPDWVKVLIVQGKDPDEPTKYPSRSEALFAVCCELIRRNVDDETIFGVITDPDLGISESIVEKGKNSEKYAIRQLERAHEYAIDPQLQQLNEKHAVISDTGGKCKIISEVFDFAMGRPRISRQSFEDFRNRYMNQKVEIGTDKQGNMQFAPLGKWWLSHNLRRQYDTMVFAPGQDTPNIYNLWKGFACEAIPGDCSLFLGHVENIICGGQPDYYTYILGWMARCVQQPDSPGQTAIVLRGKQGTGKSFFAKTLGSLFGRHFMPVSDPKHLIGSFNSHLRDIVLLFGDEAFFAGDKKHESILKMLITEEIITIEAKGIDAESAPNFTHLILASNSSWVIPAGANERRFFVLDVNDQVKRNTVYFDKVQKQLDQGGREALLHYLMTYDLSEYLVQRVPQTEALVDQKLLSFAPEEEWWYRKLDDGRLLTHHNEWTGEVSKEALLDDYLTYTQRIGITRKANATALGKFLRRVCPPKFPMSYQRRFTQEEEQNYPRDSQSRPYFYRFPELWTCRQKWDEVFEGPFRWTVFEDPDKEKKENAKGIFS